MAYQRLRSYAFQGCPVVPRISFIRRTMSATLYFLFEEALPIVGPKRCGGPFGGHGVLFMQALELGAFLRANDGVGLGHESILLASGALD